MEHQNKDTDRDNRIILSFLSLTTKKENIIHKNIKLQKINN
jgi:hypothetical protein